MTSQAALVAGSCSRPGSWSTAPGSVLEKRLAYVPCYLLEPIRDLTLAKPDLTAHMTWYHGTTRPIEDDMITSGHEPQLAPASQQGAGGVVGLCLIAGDHGN